MTLLLLMVACSSQPDVPLAPAYTLRPTTRPGVAFVSETGGVRAGSAPGRPGAWFDMDGGVRLGDDLRLRTTAVGRAATPNPVDPATPFVGTCDDMPCVRLEATDVTEYWTEWGDGFEQGWTIPSRPEGAGELVVDLSIASAGVSLIGVGAELRTSTGQTWTVSDLQAWDADGKVLSSRFETSGGGLRIAVDDGAARYPVWIDPVYSTPDYTLMSTAFVVAGGGDVNHDGYVDVVMSSHNSDAGVVNLNLGTSAGFDETMPNSQLAYLYDNEHLDYVPVAFAGDVNGDGYEEVIVSAPSDERVNVYAGGAGGLESFRPDPTWTLPEFAGHSIHLGENDTVASVAGAGDVNGDGYDDVIVGVPTIDAPGHATVYLGSSAGVLVDETAVELRGSNAGDDGFGRAVAGAGDVNADGYADVIVTGSPDTEVYYGSATGVTTAGTALQTDGTAWAVAGAGDVNGDGYADVIVGVPSGAGKALVFLGGPGGITPTPAWERDGLDVTDYDLYGFAVAGAGDVNGDGYDDIITGSEQIPDIFLGSATGLEAEPVATLDGGGCSVSGAGDVDRDGFDDVVVGGGNVYLAATFLRDDSDADSGAGPGSGCDSAKRGCATVPDASIGVALTMVALGVATARRRPHTQRHPETP